jgi:hypothetical protein
VLNIHGVDVRQVDMQTAEALVLESSFVELEIAFEKL